MPPAWGWRVAGRHLTGLDNRVMARPEHSRQGEEPTFFQAHRGGIEAIWRRDARAWWHDHYVSSHGAEPPEGWWRENPSAAAGGQIAPGRHREFGYFDPAVLRRFFAEMEARYRHEAGLPALGEGWVSETHLARCVAEALPGHEVTREARLPWLTGQRLDVFVADLAVAFEYQGVQHYEPVEHFGGPEALAHRQVMDERKRVACRGAGVTLIEWPFDEVVSAEAVAIRLRKAGIRTGNAG